LLSVITRHMAPERRVEVRIQRCFSAVDPERRDDREAREAHAKQICAQCHVRDDC